MRWIFLSPHLDDAALSCGGLIFELVQSGQAVQVWTVCAGDPPPGRLSPLAQALHARWQTGADAPAVRRSEDITACRLLGALPVHFPIPECIYRRRLDSDQALIKTNEELFQPLPESEKPLATRIAGMVSEKISEDDRLVSPLAIGGHLDHHLVRAAAESLQHRLYYYSDYPYLTSSGKDLAGLIDPGWLTFNQPISDRAVKAWKGAVAEYRTQISTFWSSVAEMERSLQEYRDQGGGSQLWLSSTPLR